MAFPPRIGELADRHVWVRSTVSSKSTAVHALIYVRHGHAVTLCGITLRQYEGVGNADERVCGRCYAKL